MNGKLLDEGKTAKLRCSIEGPEMGQSYLVLSEGIVSPLKQGGLTEAVPWKILVFCCYCYCCFFWCVFSLSKSFRFLRTHYFILFSMGPRATLSVTFPSVMFGVLDVCLSSARQTCICLRAVKASESV